MLASAIPSVSRLDRRSKLKIESAEVVYDISPLQGHWWWMGSPLVGAAPTLWYLKVACNSIKLS